MPPLSLAEKNALRSQFKREFDKSEIKLFFFELGLEVDNLESAERDKLIADLIHFSDKQGRLSELLKMASELRPNTAFLALKSAPESAASSSISPAAISTVSSNTANTANKAEVFISYAWNEKDSEENERLVNQLQAELSQRNIEIIRDKQHLGYKGDIKQFMQKIGRGHYVIVVLSDKYLKSKNCMFELLEIAKQGHFADRIFPIVLSSSNIYDPLTLITYIEYWEQQIVRLEEAMRKVGAANLHGIREEIDNYTAIRAAIAALTSTIANMNTLTPKMHQQAHFEQLYIALQEKIKQDNAA